MHHILCSIIRGNEFTPALPGIKRKDVSFWAVGAWPDAPGHVLASRRRCYSQYYAHWHLMHRQTLLDELMLLVSTRLLLCTRTGSHDHTCHLA